MKQRRILIADDNDANRGQLKQLVETEYLRVDTARDGNEALQALLADNYSVLITDLRMPKLTGMQLIEEIGKHRLPVTAIVMTGHGSTDEAIHAMRLGAYDFLTKP